MILKNNDYLNIIKKLRKEIVKQSELPPENVLNALSDNGTRLSQIINETITNSFESTDSFIIFELIEDTSSLTLIATDDDGGESIVPYNFNLKIYGELSHDVAQKISIRLKSSEVAFNLRENGLHVKSISSATPTHEFINNTLWMRVDITINLNIRYYISNLEDVGYFSKGV